MKNTYTGTKSYEGLKGLRHNRSMYLGSYGVLNDGHAPRALNQTIQEVVSNSIDEYLVGAGNEIKVTIHKDNSVTIEDQGRGMRKGPGDSFDDVYGSLTIPHTSGKFEGTGYAGTGTAGMHGIGLKATNATSEYFKLHAISPTTVLVNGEKELDGALEEYEITLKMEEVLDQRVIRRWEKDDIEEISINQFRVKSTGEIITTGTTITYLPDAGPEAEDNKRPVFESINWVNEDLYPRFESSAFLNAGLTMTFVDERKYLVIENEDGVKEETDQPLSKSWYFERGVEEYVERISESQTLLSKMKKPITFIDEMYYEDLQFKLQTSLIFTDDTDENIRSFANGVPTKDGGPHVDGFRTALTKVINDFAKSEGLNKIKSNGKSKKAKTIDSFSQKDIFEGITGVIEIKVPSDIAEFEGQTKEKLGTVQANPVVKELITKHMTNWLYDNKPIAEQIITKIIESKMASDAAVKARQEAKKARQTKSIDNLRVSSKLKPATGKDPKKKELFITEGDSASNISRDQLTQGIMPLRGKILNVEDVPLGDALKNEEISTITSTLGTGIGPAFDISDLQYHKIVFACFTGDTKVKALDGNSYSFNELVDNNIKDLWIYALDKSGNMVPAKANNIRKTGETTELVQLTLDNGEIIRSTRDHMFMTVAGKYVRADELKADDRLMPLHTKINDKGYEEYYDKNTQSFIKTYRRVAEFVSKDEMIAAENRLAVEDHYPNQNGIVVHHADENKLNNEPTNLKWLTSKEYFIEHAKTASEKMTRYNKSEEHKDRVKELHKQGHYANTYFGQAGNGYNGSDLQKANLSKAWAEGRYDNATFNANGWNGSDKQKAVTAKTNKSEKHILAGKKGKILGSIKYLILNDLPFDEYHYDYYRNIGAVRYNNILSVFDSFETAYVEALDYEYKPFTHACDYSYDYDNNKKQQTQIAKVIKKLIEDGLEFTRENYDQVKGSRTIKYDNITKWFDSYETAYEYAENLNHKVMDVEFITLDEPIDVFCMTVPEYHNFLLDSGVFVKNCDADSDGNHILMLLITLFYKYFRPLIEQGHVYVAIPPLYKATKYVKGKPQVKWYYSETEIAKERAHLLEENYTIQRFKGLGEMNPKEVGEAIANKETRHLAQLTISDADEVAKTLRILMGKESNLRKEWVAENIDYDDLYEVI